MADKKENEQKNIFSNERLTAFFQTVGGEQLKLVTAAFENANVEREKLTEFMTSAAKTTNPDALTNLAIGYYAGVANRSMTAFNNGKQAVEDTVKAMRSL